MAGQRSSSLTDDSPRRARARAALPAPRRGPDGPAPDRRRGRPPGRTRTRTRRPAPRAVLTGSLVLPVLGALLDELRGAAPGGVFAVLTVLGAVGAAWLATRAGWWWVLTAIAPVVLASTAGAELLAGREDYGDVKALAAAAAKWAVHGFPVMVSALLAAAAAVGLRLWLERGGRGGRAAC
ncbi:DUF6542 domain-containing protein [Kitasatospora viridis]|uniref:DUF6542 domain-containing protein n=1 Tax=Kitasatospora viridis TaxID=281105 RepID=A0A561UEG5_9ACTN|nr:DUF6542 domain-containing protein [Kitasatospora viridis]TWF97751.1 hypothetical protein FHX73_111546 [Kitasatospora viridis]